MKVLMFGWELPPFNSGGLGVACDNLAEALLKNNVDVTFVLPKKINLGPKPYKVVFASMKNWAETIMCPYKPSISLMSEVPELCYLSNLFSEVLNYGILARNVSLREDFDIIHAHDWLCYPAGIEAKKATGKPLVVHVHATEFDRTGGKGINEQVYQIEKAGMETADKVVAVSNYTKQIVVRHYGIPAEKVEVVWNGIDIAKEIEGVAHENPEEIMYLKKMGKKIVLFVGRITLQKGADYFIEAARKASEHDPDIIFVIAGSGDMEEQIINQAIHAGISDKVIFTGFVRGEALKRIYKSADLYVLPSVSEPFGLTVLESLAHNTPVMISKQSGVSEVITNALKVDFWDVDDMADKMVAAVNHPPMNGHLRGMGHLETIQASWNRSAGQCANVYSSVVTTV